MAKKSDAALRREIAGALATGKRLLADIDERVASYERRSSQGLVGIVGACAGAAGGALIGWHVAVGVTVVVTGGALGVGIVAPLAMLGYRLVTAKTSDAQVQAFTQRMSMLSAQMPKLKEVGAPDHVIAEMWRTVEDCAIAIRRVSRTPDAQDLPVAREAPRQLPAAIPPPQLPEAALAELVVGVDTVVATPDAQSSED
jgi:hypothetical protein